MDRTLTLYHGSSLILKRPQFGKGNPFHDYGLGFYCTETLEVAKEWACSMAQDGFVNRYSFRTGGLSILNLADGNYTILNWLSILLIGRGMVWGNVVGLGLCLVQQLTGFLALDAATYYMDRVPIAINGWHVLLLNIGTLVASVLMLVGPSCLIARIRPADSMRYE